MLEIGVQNKTIHKVLDRIPGGVISLPLGVRWYREYVQGEYVCYDGTVLVSAPIYKTERIYLKGPSMKSILMWGTLWAVLAFCLILLASCSWLAEPAFPPDPNYERIISQERGPIPPMGGGPQRQIPWPTDNQNTITIIRQYVGQ